MICFTIFALYLFIGCKPVEIVTSQRSPEWYHQRRLRITASNCHDVSSCKSSQRAGSIINKQLWSNQPLSTVSMKYGQLHESDARLAFCAAMQMSVSGLAVIETGMWVNPQFPQIACSPDGLVYDPTMPVASQYGLIEIKCPKVIENTSPLEAKDSLTKEQWHSFCLADSEGKLMLKRSHKYYYQVQCQLGVCELLWCYFVVWSKEGIFIEKIYADPVFWQSTKKKLLSFHEEYLCPEYFEMRLPRKLSLIKLE